jgi:HPt (histidine-containing phosphotransfer) domain-containing protein
LDEKTIEIGKLAHQLKPSFTMVGLPEITQSLQLLEKKAKQNEPFEELKVLYEEIEELFYRKIKLVEAEWKTLNL